MFKKLILSVASLAALATVAPAALHAAPTNLINNPSVETANGTLPSGWNQGKWGTNTTAFTYKTTEGNTGTKSLYTSMTARTSGDAKWYFTDIAVKPSQKYTYSEFYKSNVTTEVDVQYTDTSGKLSYGYLNAPAASSTAWKPASTSFTTPANVKTLTIFHVIDKVGWVQTDDFSLVEGDGTVTPPTPTAPTVAFTSPAANATISGAQSVSANASDTISMAGVQFKLDGANLGTEDTTAPYSVNWDAKTATNGNHTLSAIARNSSGLTSTVTETVNVQNVAPTPPTVAFTAPASGSTVSGSTVAVSANASDNVGVLGVQFKLDGANLGTEDTTAPYSVNMDSTAIANGSHTLTATARNGASLTTTATETVNVQNTVVTPPTPPASPNLIPNPSLETANGTAPANWLSSNWGTNTTTFSYLPTGHTGSHSVKVESTAYTNGAANWYYADIPVSSGKTYKYENWYQSNVDTEVDAEVLMNDGTTQYYWVGTVPTSPAWAKYSNTFTVPTGAKSIAIYQILAKKGYIVSDDYSLSEYIPLPLNRGLVSVTFDDGWTNQYTNAFPMLTKYGLPATFYIISGELTDQPDYMTATQVKNLQQAGHEIGSHSVTHPDLTTVSAAQLQNEMKNSQVTLQSVVGVPITNFAYPFGAYNSSTIAVGKQYYQSQRSVDRGLNTKDNFDLTRLKIQEVDSNISQAQVQGWINAAMAQKAWLVLVYHEIAVTPSDPTDQLYTTQPGDLDSELSYLKNSGVTVLTVNQAIHEITPQL
jgi:peptidoglycan/xylan/chitin deacetylase (PgdA/CDA1 family)